MHDSDIRRHNAAILKCLLSPFQKNVSLSVTFELAIGIECERGGCAELVDLHGMIDDEIDLLKRIDFLGVPTHFFDYVTHRREVYDCRNTSEILHQDAGRPKRDLFCRLS